jgi:hypothetical protein
MVELIVLSGLSAGAAQYCRKNPILAIALTGVLVLNVLNYDMMRNHRQHLRPGLVGGTGLLDIRDTNWILPPN